VTLAAQKFDDSWGHQLMNLSSALSPYLPPENFISHNISQRKWPSVTQTFKSNLTVEKLHYVVFCGFNLNSKQ